MSRSANLRPRRLDAAYLATSVARRTGHIVGIAEKTVGPLLDLLIRLWLAQIFWASGMVELQNWTAALLPSTHQYPAIRKIRPEPLHEPLSPARHYEPPSKGRYRRRQ